MSDEEYAECAASNAKKFEDVGRTLGVLLAVRLVGVVEGFAVNVFFAVRALLVVLLVALLVVFSAVDAAIDVVVFLGLMDIIG